MKKKKASSTSLQGPSPYSSKLLQPEWLLHDSKYHITELY